MMHCLPKVAMVVFGTVLVGVPAGAQIKPSPESLQGLYPGAAYSPNVGRSFPSQVFWGDTHLHT